MELSVAQLRELIGIQSSSVSSGCPFEIGKSYLIRTVTMINLGRVRSIVGNFIVLESAGWIADTGRYSECLTKGTFNEFEPYPDISIVGMGAIVDAQPWSHELPRQPK